MWPSFQARFWVAIVKRYSAEFVLHHWTVWDAASEMKSDRYDIPDFGKPLSPVLSEFLYNWFENSFRMSRRDVDLGFLSELTPEELEYARDVLRRNLHLGDCLMIEGTAALVDRSAVPALRKLLKREKTPGGRLTIAGSLWVLAKDEAFYNAIVKMMRHGNSDQKWFYFDRVLWLADGRALDLLFGFLDDCDPVVRDQAVGYLDLIEGRGWLFRNRPHEAHYYRPRRDNERFRAKMTERLKSEAGEFLRTQFGPLGAEAVLRERSGGRAGL